MVGVVADLLSATQVGYVAPAIVSALAFNPLTLIAKKLTETQIGQFSNTTTYMGDILLCSRRGRSGFLGVRAELVWHYDNKLRCARVLHALAHLR